MNNYVKLKFDEVVNACIVIENAKDTAEVKKAINTAASIIAVNIKAININYQIDPEDVCKIIYDTTFSAVMATSDIKAKYTISMAANAFTNAVIAFANPGIYSAYGAALKTADFSITEYRIDNIPPLGT